MTVRTTYVRSRNQAIIQFTTAFVSAQGATNKYDGNFYFDPSTQRLRTWYAHDDFTITQAPIQIEADGFSMSFDQSDGAAPPQNYRVVVTRTGSDAYTWDIYQRGNAAWAKQLTLHFVRS